MGQTRYWCYRYYTGDPDRLPYDNGRLIHPPEQVRDWRLPAYARFRVADFATSAEATTWLQQLVVDAAADIQHLSPGETPDVAAVLRKAETALADRDLAFQWRVRFPYEEHVLILAVLARWETDTDRDPNAAPIQAFDISLPSRPGTAERARHRGRWSNP